MGISLQRSVLRQWPLLALLALLWGCAALPVPVPVPVTVPVPDLGTFIQRRAECDHARGEFPDPPDPHRVREVVMQVAKYCTGTDAQLAALKNHYRLDAEVLHRLAAFEPLIEKTVK
jgi:hypothetical protein